MSVRGLGSEPGQCIGIMDFKITELLPDSPSASQLSQPAAHSSTYLRRITETFRGGDTHGMLLSCVSTFGRISCIQVSLMSQLFGIVRGRAAVLLDSVRLKDNQLHCF